MNIPVIFQFLKELSANNNREWFNSHREQYEVARSEFENLLTVIISRISLFDESIRGIEAKDCTYRIYRDTRFSEDKTPYKTHLGGYINAKGKKSDHCGYYVHLEPGNCLLAGGSYCPPDTPIILLDEPTSFLDMPNRYELVALLRRLVHDEKKCIMFSTHELDIALSMCDSIALLDTPNLSCLTASEMQKSGYIDRLFQNENIRFDSLCGTMILKQ